MASYSARDDVDITKDEVKQIKEALKKDEFRKLLNHYFEEVSDPKNKAQFQKELIEFEKERGVDVTFVNPEPGYVIKSSVDGKRKAFINICSNDNVAKPSSSAKSQDGSPGLNWSIPYLQGYPREDLDKKNVRCTVYDVVFHPDTLYLAKKNLKIKELVDDIALSAVEDVFKVKLDRKNLVYPKLKYKGYQVATVIRKKRDDYEERKASTMGDDLLAGCPYGPPPPKDKTPRVLTPRSNCDPNDESVYTTPRYIIKHRRELDLQECTYAIDAKYHSAIPTDLIVEIDLPLIRAAGDVNLDVVDKSLSLISEHPAKYKLNIILPYSVDDERGNAKFDKAKKKLIVSLPVKRSKFKLPELAREDSGIESDANQNNSSSSEEDIRKNVECDNTSEISGEESDKYNNNNIALRTSEEVKTLFLNPAFHYSCPNNRVTIDESSLSFRLVVRNIDPKTVTHQFIYKSEGVHIKFTSLGTGFFPIYYAFCLRIPQITLDTSSLNIDVWDNCLTGDLKILSQTRATTYYVGTCLESMQERMITVPCNSGSSESKENLINDENSIINDSTNENEFSRDLGTKLILNEILNNNINNNSENCIQLEGENKDVKQKVVTTSSTVQNKSLGKALFKSRTLSETNELPDSIVCSKRSILKGSRSLSESHTDDFNTWSSLDSESHEDLTANKKTVRFSDVVSKKIFRANSSILGQRKKNEKKVRNKKKAAYERMLSSSSRSEESETDREECDTMSECSDISSDDSNGSGSSGVPTVVPSSKKHRRRGAKNQRKVAATAKQNHFIE